MDKNKLKDQLKGLKEIVEWFDKQEEVDVEAGLDKVKEGVALIKVAKERLKELENEFEKVKKGLDGVDVSNE
jgi:exonuclease VII small subunit